MTIEKRELVKRFTNAILEGNAAIFAGAGLSRPSGYVDWKDLVSPLAEAIHLSVDKETDLLAVAQYYKNSRKTAATINLDILNAFSKDVQTNENIEIISRLPISTYWTTNYDELLENGIRDANRNPDVKSESDQLPLAKHGRDAVVYKMHGDVNRPANAVLTKSDYELYTINRPFFRTALQGDLVTKTFLFIGFSFADPNLDYVLSQIHTLLGTNCPEHYCFSKRVQKSDYTNDDDFAYAKAKQELQIDNLQNYGIQTVYVDSFSEITEILREIEHKVKYKNVFISGASEDYTLPWDEAGADLLAQQLASALIDCDCHIYSGFGLGIGSSIINGVLEKIKVKKYCHMDEHLSLRPFPQNTVDPDKRKQLWREYREQIIKETGVSIFLFGNKYDKSSGQIIDSVGCFEEYEIAKNNKHIIIPIGSTGYAAKNIYDDVKKNIKDYPYLADIIDDLGTETDPIKISELVSKVIKNVSSAYY
jgi:hypothetical protein